MTNKEILEKAVEKAYQNGNFSITGILGYGSDEDGFREGCIRVLVYRYINNNDKLIDTTLIFSHDFAKAFWGESYVPDSERVGSTYTWNKLRWEYHLQQMILEEDPLKYLEKFI